MEKYWKKIEKTKYSFLDKEQEITSFQINPKTNEAIINYKNTLFTLKKRGFWKKNIKITTNENQEIILNAYNKNWYSSAYVLEFQENIWKVIVRNNPLAELAIIDNHKNTILAYGLKTDNKGKIIITIKPENNDVNVFLHIFLYYLILPMSKDANDLEDMIDVLI